MVRLLNPARLEWHRRESSSQPIPRIARKGHGDGPLLGETIAFTGRLSMSRELAAMQASFVGAEIADSVSKRTTILVVGDQDLRVTKGQESAKHRRAEELIQRAGASRSSARATS